MLEAMLIEQCADPSLEPSIVEFFLHSVGSDDPLAITVSLEGRRMLIPKPRNSEEALLTLRAYVGKADVRVGVTQMPAGLGITDPSQLHPGLVEACDNLRQGTRLFAKIGRIVTRWYGTPNNDDILPQMLEDTIYAWRTGAFEGISVFRAEDPGGTTFTRRSAQEPGSVPNSATSAVMPSKTSGTNTGDSEVGSAEMRIDLSRLKEPV